MISPLSNIPLRGLRADVLFVDDTDAFAPFGPILSNSPLFAGLFDRSGASDDQKRFDVEESDASYTLSMPLPGVKRDQITLHITPDHRLSVAVTQTGPKARRAFNRTVQLGSGIDHEGVTAKLEDGVLTVTVPKAQSARPRAIPII